MELSPFDFEIIRRCNLRPKDCYLGSTNDIPHTDTCDVVVQGAPTLVGCMVEAKGNRAFTLCFYGGDLHCWKRKFAPDRNDAKEKREQPAAFPSMSDPEDQMSPSPPQDIEPVAIPPPFKPLPEAARPTHPSFHLSKQPFPTTIKEMIMSDFEYQEYPDNLSCSLCLSCDESCDTSEPCEHCDQQNSPPVITDFGASTEIGDFWTFEGTVYDADDPVAGMVVQLGGVLAPYGLTATVDSDGTFSVTAELPNLETGTATAQTSDIHGALSNVAMTWVPNDY